MMWAFTAAGVLIALIAVLVVCVAVGINVDPGRRALLGLANERLKAATGAELRVDALGGVWPFTLEARDVSFTDAHGDLARVDRVSLAWRPLAVLNQRIVVDAITVDGLSVSRLPSQSATTEPAAMAPAKDVFPVPPITVRRLDLNDLTVSPHLVPGGARATMTASLLTQDTPSPIDKPALVITLQGHASPVAAPQSPLSAIAADQIALAGRVAVQPDQITVRALTLTAADAAAETPLAQWDVAGRVTTQTLDLTGDIRLDPGLTNHFGLQTEAATRLRLAVSGPVADMTVNAALTAPAWRYNGVDGPPIAADLMATGLPTGLDAALTASAQPGGARQAEALSDFTAEIRVLTPDWRVYTAPRVVLDDGGMRIDGAGEFDANAAEFNVDIVLKTEDFAASPIAGVLDLPLAGDLDLTLQAARVSTALEAAPFTLRAVSDQLIWGEYAAVDVRASASGVLTDFTTQIAIADVLAPGAPAIGAIDLSANVKPALFTAVADNTSHVVALNALTAQINDRALALAAPTQLQIDGRAVTLASTAITYGEAKAAVSGRYSPQAIALDLSIADAFIPAIGSIVDVTANMDTRRTGDAPMAAFTLAITPTAQDSPAALSVEGIWDGRWIEASTTLRFLTPDPPVDALSILTARAPLALEQTPAGSPAGWAVDPAGELSARVAYAGPADALLRLVDLPDQRLTGDLDIDLSLQGPYEALTARGAARLTDGTFDHDEFGVRLTELAVTASGGADASSAALDLTLSASTGEPREEASPPAVRGVGALRFANGRLALELTADLARAALIQRGDIAATMSGQVRAAGALPDLMISGDLRVDALDAAVPDNPAQQASVDAVRVVRVDGPGGVVDDARADRADDQASVPLAITLDLGVTADSLVFVRGRGLDSEWSADLRITGSASRPDLAGDLTIRRGALDFAGRRLDITAGEVVFDGGPELDPQLQVRAETLAQTGERVFVDVTGRASDPTIAFSSEPTLPREDVMALLLFGKPATQLTAFESVRLAQALASLGGVGPLGGQSVLDKARRSLGLDALSVTQGEDGAAGLSVGKYVSDRIFISANQDVTGEAGALAVSIVLTDTLSLQTDVGQDASGSVGLTWSFDY